MGTEQYPFALPVVTGLTEQEAQDLVILFGSLVPPGRPLEGRYVYSSLTMTDDNHALAVLREFKEMALTELERMRSKICPPSQ